jgi:hypothetical protein
MEETNSSGTAMAYPPSTVLSLKQNKKHITLPHTEADKSTNNLLCYSTKQHGIEPETISIEGCDSSFIRHKTCKPIYGQLG